MVKRIALYALAFAATAVVYGLAKSALKGDGLAVDPGLIVTMAVVGVLGAVISWRRERR